MATTQASGIDRITELLGDEADDLLTHRPVVPVDRLTLPGWTSSSGCGCPRTGRRLLRAAVDRDPADPRAPGGTGYMSILPVDQGIEHSAGASFTQNPDYFDPSTSPSWPSRAAERRGLTLGVLGTAAPPVRAPIPPDQGQPQRAPDLSQRVRPDHVRLGRARPSTWAPGLGATIYFGSEESQRQIQEVSAPSRPPTSTGIVTVFWCYLRNAAFNKTKVGGPDYHGAADLTGQANHLGVTIEADIIKQKLPRATARASPTSGSARPTPRSYTNLLTATRSTCAASRYQQLRGPHGPDQLRRRLVRGERPVRGGADRRGQ